MITQYITLRLIYLVFYIIAFGIGLYVKKYHKGLHILVGLLGLGLFTEYLVSANNAISDVNYEDYIYNIYVPFEYFLYASFFYCINKNRYIRKSILISIPLFIVSILIFSEFKAIFGEKLRTNIYVLSGIFTIIWSLWTLFILEPIKGITFKTHPLFWICTGLIIFYSVNTPYNLMYDSLKELDKDLFKLASKIVQRGSNMFLYLIISIGFICSHRMKK